MAQIRIATTRLTEATSNEASAAKRPGARLPSSTPAAMHSATHTER